MGKGWIANIYFFLSCQENRIKMRGMSENTVGIICNSSNLSLFCTY